MRNPFKRREKMLTASSEALSAIRGNWNPYPLLGGGSRQRILEAYNTAKSANYAWLYTRSPALRTVIDVITRNIGQLDLRLYEELSESERQPRPDHPAAISLRYPNEESPGDQFVRHLFQDYLIFDDAVALMKPMGERTVFEWLPFHMIEIKGDSLFRADIYRLSHSGGGFTDFVPGEILHWHGENPHDPRTGLSRLDTLRDVLAEDAALQQATVELANSGLTQQVYGYRPVEAPEITGETLDRMEEDLGNRLRRSTRLPFILQEGTELRPIGVSPRDAQMAEIRRTAIERVAGVYGVPLGMVGLADNIKEAQQQFYADTLPPLCEAFTRMLNQRILVRVYNWTDGCFEFNLDEKHMGDDRLKSLTSATGRPVMLTNEARAKLNLPPVDGGDELVTPMNVVVGENPQATIDMPNDAAPNGQPRGVGYEQEQRKALKAASEDRLPQLHPGRRDELDRHLRNIDLAKAVVERHFNRLGRSLRNKAGKADWARWDREFADDIHNVVERIAETEGAIYAFKLAGNFDMAQVKNYLRAMSEGAAEGINAKIRADVDELGVEDALALRGQYVDAWGASLGGNATTWTRDEAAKQSPGHHNRVKTWIPHTKRHSEFGGQTVPVGEDWPAGFAPGTVPGCRCTYSIQ